MAPTTDVGLEVLATGLEFPEGPIAMADGSVLVVEIRRGTLTRVRLNGTVERLVDLGGGPNGAAIGPDGAVYVVNNGGFLWAETDIGVIPDGTPKDYTGGCVQRVDLETKSCATLYTACEDIALRGPNDIVFDKHGGFYFTDMGKWNDHYQTWGAVYYALPDGSEIRSIRQGLLSPNGIGLSPGGDTLYVAESLGGRLWAFDVVAPGVVADPPGRWRPGRHIWTSAELSIYDSLAVEAGGNVCIAVVVRGGIDIISADGTSCANAPVPSAMTTNICFGGDDMRTAWITGGNTGILYRGRWPRPGLKLAFNI